MHESSSQQIPKKRLLLTLLAASVILLAVLILPVRGSALGTPVESELPKGSYIDEQGHLRDNTDYPFIDDPQAIGYWKAVDFVKSPEQFTAGQKYWQGELFLKDLHLLPEGKTNLAFRWTKGLIIHEGEKKAARYLFRQEGGDDYLFFEWKSGDYTLRHSKPALYVLKREEYRPYVESRVVDKTDYPFIDDQEVVGTWKAVDLVKSPEEFLPGQQQWKGGELFLKELEFAPDGSMGSKSITWTKGLVLHHQNKTASAYQIKEFDGHKYMFFEWKSGDYTFRMMKPYYYVLKQEL